jgi:hypothetical protein
MDGYDRGTEAEVRIRRNPLSCVFIEVLPLGLGWPMVSRSCVVRRGGPGSPKTSGDADGQRANGNNDQRRLPWVLNYAAMLRPFHIHITADKNSYVPNYTVVHQMA